MAPGPKPSIKNIHKLQDVYSADNSLTQAETDALVRKSIFKMEQRKGIYPGDISRWEDLFNYNYLNTSINDDCLARKLIENRFYIYYDDKGVYNIPPTISPSDIITDYIQNFIEDIVENVYLIDHDHSKNQLTIYFFSEEDLNNFRTSFKLME